MGKVEILPEEVRARIAAGEFVTSPRAVVRELVENSLDAGAGEVRVSWRENGFSITVADDGEGIFPDDLPRVFQRFATSKVKDLSDLGSVDTFGFRGEALYAISSVSRGKLVSRREEEETAWEVEYEFGRVGEVREAARERGTTVEVKDLFRNYPVRRIEAEKRFRPSSLLELLALYSLLNPRVRFRALAEGEFKDLSDPLKVLAPKGVADAVLKGRSSEDPGVEVEVWLSPPERFFSSNRWIFVGVNGRPVRSPLVVSAVRKGVAPYLPSYKHPFAVVSLRVPPSDADFNLHPGKEEVGFRSEKRVFAAVLRAVNSALSVYEAVRREESVSQTQITEEFAEPLVLREECGEEEEREEVRVEFVAQLHLTYILVRVGEKYLLFDQHALCERLNYNALLRGGRRKVPLLFPVNFPFPRSLTPEEVEALDKLGYEVSPADGGVELRSVPSFLADHRGVALFSEVLGTLEAGGFAESTDAYRELACKSSVKAGEPLSPGEAERMVRAWLEEEGEKHTCPHGRNLVVELSEDFLRKFFGR